VQQLTMEFVDFGNSNCIIEPIGKEVVTRLPSSLSGIVRQVVTLS